MFEYVWLLFCVLESAMRVSAFSRDAVTVSVWIVSANGVVIRINSSRRKRYAVAPSVARIPTLSSLVSILVTLSSGEKGKDIVSQVSFFSDEMGFSNGWKKSDREIWG